MSVGTSGKRFDRTWLPELGETVSEEQFQTKFVSPFATWADIAIPEDPYTQSFDLDDHGFPIFPKVDLLRTTGEGLQGVMDGYLNDLYSALLLI